LFHRSEQGASALEFALVLPILVTVLFGAISFGLAFNAKMQISHAARESVRFAATYAVPDSGMNDWFKAVVNRAVNTSAGQTPVWDDEVFICVSMIPESGPIVTKQMQGGTGNATSADLVDNGADSASACFTDNLTDDRVQVRIIKGTDLNLVFLSRPVTLTEQGVARFEAGGS